MKRREPAVTAPRVDVRPYAGPYERPRIISREKLEVIAAVCSPGKGPLQPGDCLLNANS